MAAGNATELIIDGINYDMPTSNSPTIGASFEKEPIPTTGRTRQKVTFTDPMITIEVIAEADLYEDLVESSKKEAVDFAMVHNETTYTGSASIVLGEYKLETLTVEIKASPIDRKWTVT